MIKKISLDENYSTTKMLITEQPIMKTGVDQKFETILFLPEDERRQGEGGLRTKGYFKKSYDDKPLVSIITVVFNGEQYLEQTIQSVITQTYDNVEYIIIDGGSTDGTLDIIRKYEEQIDYWVSEPDKGIYDAMNKGLQLSNGKINGIINADDWYVNDAIEQSLLTLLKTKADYTVGNVLKVPSKMSLLPIFPLKDKIYQGMMYPHIGAFIKKSVYSKVGLFDTEYKVSADFDMAMRIHLAGFNAAYVQQVVGNVLEGGVSAGNITREENMSISIKYGRNPFLAKVLFYKYYFKAKLKACIPLTLLKRIED